MSVSVSCREKFLASCAQDQLSLVELLASVSTMYVIARKFASFQW